jgi:chromosome segregation ATPase
MKVSVADYERAVKLTQERLTRERGDAEGAAKALEEARGKLGSLETRTSELERQLFVQTTEAEILSRRVQELEVRLGEQGRVLAEREFQIDRLRGELQTARNTETALRTELGTVGSRGNTTVDKFRADIDQLEAQLASAIEERSRLQGEIATMKREAETSWASERVENALLRERINDVAAEVARLTAALEGPNSPIESMLAADAPPLGERMAHSSRFNGGTGGTGPIDAPQQNKISLADRIRALQAGASRVSN